MLRKFDPATIIIERIEVGYRQIVEQSRGWFYLSLVAAGIGLIFICFGSSDIATFASIVANAISVLFFAQSKAANNRVDSIHSELIEAYRLSTYIKITDSIVNPDLRDELRAKVVTKMLDASKRKRVKSSRRKK